MKNETKLIDRITEHFGTAYAAAKALDVHPSQYYLWVNGSKKIPFVRGRQIESATGGAVKAIEVWEAW